MRTRIKICCIASIDEAQLAIAAGADALGLVAAGAQIAAWTPPPVAAFLLTAETTAQRIAGQVAAIAPGTVQFAHRLDVHEVTELARLLPSVRRVQVINAQDEQAPQMIARHAPHVHAFLLKPGSSPDWAACARLVRTCQLPIFLAGGLDHSNMAGVLRLVRPYGVDLCASVRTDGHLDIIKLALLTSAVREADALLYAEG